MKIYSAYSFIISALHILTQFISTPYTPPGTTRNIYVFAVALRVVHPLVLLLPAVDLLSVAAIGVSRLSHSRAQG